MTPAIDEKYQQLTIEFEGVPTFAAWIEAGKIKRGLVVKRVGLSDEVELPNDALPYICGFEKSPSPERLILGGKATLELNKYSVTNQIKAGKIQLDCDPRECDEEEFHQKTEGCPK